MKKKIVKLISIFVVMVIVLISKNYFVLAQESIYIMTDKESVEKDEEFEISVNVNDTSIASLTLQIYFDMTKLEYLDKTEKANFAQNRVIYTWFSQDGGKTARQSNEIQKFTFKAIQDGTANIVVTGEFYDKNGNVIDIGDGNIEIQIGTINEQQNNEQSVADENEEQVSNDNTNLKVMRLNEAGVSPDFQKEIKEYYFIADNSINKLDVTAIPENKDAIVTITGNTNLKQGLNTINIQVQSADRTKKTDYKIYVTKTDNKILANANLETLAVKETTMFPPFDANITQYDIEVSNDIDKVEVLAVPERMNATVTIEGNDKLEIGDNIITINVEAENGITNKKYIIKAHRRNEEEETKAKEEQKQQAEQLSEILESIQQENNNERNEENSSKMKRIDIITFVLLAMVIIGFAVGFIINKKK